MRKMHPNDKCTVTSFSPATVSFLSYKVAHERASFPFPSSPGSTASKKALLKRVETTSQVLACGFSTGPATSAFVATSPRSFLSTVDATSIVFSKILVSRPLSLSCSGS